MFYDKNNIFAKIISGTVSSKKVYEDEKVLAFYDISKAAPTHVLIVPKGEYVNFTDFISKAKSEEVSYFFKKIDEVTKILNVEKSGFRLITNTGFDANQTVPHFHVHILASTNLGELLSLTNNS